MVEFVKHFLGICGEHWHPNIFHFIAGGLGAIPMFLYIKNKIKNYGKGKS
tara:strand:+ start:117 stop:266 length:150 start_codon:yes stop_codon:yes gene_type:complete